MPIAKGSTGRKDGVTRPSKSKLLHEKLQEFEASDESSLDSLPSRTTGAGS